MRVLSLFVASVLLVGIVAVPPASVAGTITLLGHLDPSTGGSTTSDVTGYYDPNTGREYAIVGEWQGGRVWIIDVTDPANPFVEEWLPAVTPGFDLKVWQHYLYLVDGNGSGNDGEVWDISNPAAPSPVGQFLSAHNIFIDDRGIMYNEVEGLTILDLNPDPADPTFLWSSGDPDGHDALVQGTTLYDFHGGTATIIRDVSDPAQPQVLGTISGGGVTYHHSGVVSADGDRLYINDELALSPNPDIWVYDVSDPGNPVLVDWYNDPQATIHNTYRVGNFMFASYYVAGFKVFDVSDPSNLELVDEWDTSAFTGELNFAGAWGCYPYLPSGNILVSDIENGLYVFAFDPGTTPAPEAGGHHRRLAQNRPNPVRTATRIEYELPAPGPARIRVYDALGRRVRTLVDRVQPAGRHAVSWDGRTATGRPVASGVYFYELRSEAGRETRRMIVAR